MNRGQRHARTQSAIERAQRRKRVAANLLRGATYAEIAEALGISKATVSADYKAIIDEWKSVYAERADEYVQVQMRRLDVLLNGVWDTARKGENLPMIDRALAIMDRQNALMKLGKGGTVARGVVLFEISEGLPDALALEAGDDAEA